MGFQKWNIILFIAPVLESWLSPIPFGLIGTLFLLINTHPGVLVKNGKNSHKI
jgi:hypothetical protein